MQRALKFQSTAEMDEFLKNNATKPLIPEDEPPAENLPSENLSELMIPASPGLFATLLSITAAVDQVAAQGQSVAAQAIYWSEFTKRVGAHITSDKFHDRGIKKMMVEAEKNVFPANFVEVVRA